MYVFVSSIVHTLAELKMTGNCLKGSRPLLSFDPVSSFLISFLFDIEHAYTFFVTPSFVLQCRNLTRSPTMLC